MSLLNTFVPMIESYAEPVVRKFTLEEPTSGMVALQEFQITNDIWYCMITTPNSLDQFSIVDIMGDDVYQQVLNKTASIVIDLPFEPFLDCIDSVYQHVVLRYKIPPSQVIFMSNMFDAGEFNKLSAVRNNSDPIRIFYFSALEYMLTNTAMDLDPKPLEIKSYDKKFLNLNRRWREHRQMAILLMRYRNLLDKGHVSFGPCEGQGDWNAVLGVLKARASGNSYIENAIDQSADIVNMQPMYLDTNELHTNRAELEHTTDTFYANSYFSLVSETTFYHRNYTQSSRFITEKTFKAIAMKHPFLLITIPKSLELMKFLGYKTFSPWINESYDDEMDDNARMLMILDEVERLSNMTDDEVASFIKATNNICEYNFDLLSSRSEFLYEMKETCLLI